MEKTYSCFMNEISSQELYDRLIQYGLFAEKLPPIFDGTSFLAYCHTQSRPKFSKDTWYPYVSFRKVTKKGSFPGEDAVLKALYLRITELFKKWNNRPAANWAMVRNRFAMDDGIQARTMKYENMN